MRALLVIAIVAAFTGAAYAYPQFQMSKDQTCAGCHIQPDGGGILNENGFATAEAVSQLGMPPEFMYGTLDLPDWLALGGDMRSVAGYMQTPQRYLAFIPMQLEAYAALTFGNFSGHVTVGYRPPEKDNELATIIWSREHFLQWQQEEGSEGLFIRAGRFMPIFGLRFVEHTIYTRRYGGTPLFSDTYGAAVSYVKPKYEAHLTGFFKDPLIDPVRLGSGGALYGEYRLDERTQLGAGAMVEISSYEQKYRGEVTAKYYIPKPEILLQAEVQLVNPHVGGYGYRQLVGYLMGTYFANDYLMIDLGLGHYDENIRIKNLDRDAVDLNVHYFVMSHMEVMFIGRYELMQFGNGGPSGAYAMLQAHYRL